MQSQYDATIPEEEELEYSWFYKCSDKLNYPY